MEKQIYVHYGSNKFDATKVHPKNKEFPWVKPNNALWASRIDDDDGWKNWCEWNDFHPESLKQSFRFTLKDDARIIFLRYPNDLCRLPKRKDYPEMILGSTYTIDFDACVAQGIDAIELLDVDALYDPLYGWDCNSICILNPDIVEVIDEPETSKEAV